MMAEMHGGPKDGQKMEVSESSVLLRFPDDSVYRAVQRAPYDRLHFHWAPR